MGQNRRLITTAGADFEGLAELAPGAEDLDHPRHHEGLGDGLLQTQGQRGVFVGAARKGFLDEELPRHRHHRGKHPLVADALLAQALYHARPGPLGRLQGGAQDFAAHRPSQSPMLAIWATWVRSICSGVTET